MSSLAAIEILADLADIQPVGTEISVATGHIRPSGRSLDPSLLAGLPAVSPHLEGITLKALGADLEAHPSAAVSLHRVVSRPSWRARQLRRACFPSH